VRHVMSRVGGYCVGSCDSLMDMFVFESDSIIVNISDSLLDYFNALTPMSSLCPPSIPPFVCPIAASGVKSGTPLFGAPRLTTDRQTITRTHTTPSHSPRKELSQTCTHRPTPSFMPHMHSHIDLMSSSVHDEITNKESEPDKYIEGANYVCVHELPMA